MVGSLIEFGVDSGSFDVVICFGLLECAVEYELIFVEL